MSSHEDQPHAPHAPRDASPARRLWWAAACLGLWMLSLFVGVTLGGAIHLLLLAVLALAPWRAAGAPQSSSDDPSPGDPSPPN